MIAIALFGTAAAFFAGFCLGAIFGNKRSAPATKTKVPFNLHILSEDERRELRRRQRELQNFFNYNGDEMPEIEDT